MSNIINFGGGATNISTSFKPAGKSYLMFSSPNSFTLKVNDTTKRWDGTLEYFASNKTWTVWNGATTLSSVDNDGEYVLYLRGTGNTVITGGRSSSRWVLTGNNIKCIGNIENLLDYTTVESGNHPTMANSCYQCIFQNCTALTQAPALPATTLTQNCYHNMFYNCTALTQAPALPATTLATYCYQGMFYNCTSLAQAPALPATTLAKDCYSNIFYNCASLTQAPALPATTLAENCYYQMFCYCTALTQAPALPAITLADYCYNQMFCGCTALTQAPALPATTLVDGCYANMFEGCTSLTQAPALPATTLTTRCYNSMFSGCTSLTQAPALPATTLATYCYQGMFYNCISLAQAPALPATTLATYCYQGMFEGCTSLTQAPALPAITLADYCYWYMFNGCTKIKLSSTQTEEYTQEYRIPTFSTGTTAIDALTDMFASTGGTFTSTPSINTTYYLSADNMIVRDTEVATLNGYVGSMIGSELTNIPYPVTKVAGKTGAVTLAKGDVGLGNVDNTSDVNKPISTKQQEALNGKQAKITASGLLKGNGSGGVSAAIKGTDYAGPSVGVTATLSASGWDANAKTQTVSVTGVTATANGSLRIAQSATDEQFTAWGAAQPRVTAQAAGTLTVKVAGTVPTIDIPVEVLIV